MKRAASQSLVMRAIRASDGKVIDEANTAVAMCAGDLAQALRG